MGAKVEKMPEAQRKITPADILSVAEYDQQRKSLKEMVEVRRAISQELRKFLTGSRADKNKVLALGRRYGELDGEVSWMYATAFAKVNRTLTDKQRAEFVKLRNLPGYQSAPAVIAIARIAAAPPARPRRTCRSLDSSRSDRAWRFPRRLDLRRWEAM